MIVNCKSNQHLESEGDIYIYIYFCLEGKKEVDLVNNSSVMVFLGVGMYSLQDWPRNVDRSLKLHSQD